jgi:hypothetical protein
VQEVGQAAPLVLLRGEQLLDQPVALALAAATLVATPVQPSR